MNKAEQKAAIVARAKCAIKALYHNATPALWQVTPKDRQRFGDDHIRAWFDDVASFEIDHLNSGGAYGTNYRATLQAPCNAGRYKSERAQDYYVRRGMRQMREDRDKYARHERIVTFGRLFTYGRGGRTLAPEALMRHAGASTYVNPSYVDDLTREQMVDLIQIVEAFNTFVREWNVVDNLQYMWDEHESELTADADEAACLSVN